MLGPYIKSRGTRGTKMSAKADLITVRHMYNKGKQFENHFFIYGPKCKKNVYFGGILGALRGSSMILGELSSHPYLCTCEIRKQSDKTF